MSIQFVFDIIEQEVERQKVKWGIQNHSNWVWLLILLEEIGEVADAMLKGDKDAITAELIQCAAVIVSWLSDNKRDSSNIMIPTLFLVTVKKIGEGAKEILENSNK